MSEVTIAPYLCLPPLGEQRDKQLTRLLTSEEERALRWGHSSVATQRRERKSKGTRKKRGYTPREEEAAIGDYGRGGGELALRHFT